MIFHVHGIKFLHRDGYPADELDQLTGYCLKMKASFEQLKADWVIRGNPESKATYSSYNIFAIPHPTIEFLLRHIKQNLSIFMEQEAIAQNQIWIIGWVNFLSPLQTFGMHNHGKADTFGHLLLRDQGTKNLYFEDSRLVVETKPGDLTLVNDGTLIHGTTQVQGIEERVSIGFDIFLGDKPLNKIATKVDVSKN